MMRAVRRPDRLLLLLLYTDEQPHAKNALRGNGGEGGAAGCRTHRREVHRQRQDTRADVRLEQVHHHLHRPQGSRHARRWARMFAEPIALSRQHRALLPSHQRISNGIGLGRGCVLDRRALHCCAHSVRCRGRPAGVHQNYEGGETER